MTDLAQYTNRSSGETLRSNPLRSSRWTSLSFFRSLNERVKGNVDLFSDSLFTRDGWSVGRASAWPSNVILSLPPRAREKSSPSSSHRNIDVWAVSPSKLLPSRSSTLIPGPSVQCTVALEGSPPWKSSLVKTPNHNPRRGPSSRK